MIDGALHPELIPDSRAYRLFFLAVAGRPNPTAEAAAFQRALFKRLGLGASDAEAFAIVLGNFRNRYAEIMNAYSQAADVAFARGDAPNRSQYLTFVALTDALVADTRQQLARILSFDAVSRLDSLVQREKANMRITMPPSEQPTSGNEGQDENPH